MDKKIQGNIYMQKIIIAMLITPIVSSLIILGFYYSYTKKFYREKVEIFQDNNRKI